MRLALVSRRTTMLLLAIQHAADAAAGEHDVCAGERVHVVPLPAVNPWQRHPRPRSLCANATPPSQHACSWHGKRLHGPLYNTPKYILDSIFFSRLVSRCRSGALNATLHLVPFPAADGGVSGRMQNYTDYVAAAKSALRSSASWRRCNGCDHILVTARAFSDLMCSRPVTSYRGVWHGAPSAIPFCIEDPFWVSTPRTQRPPADFLQCSVHTDSAALCGTGARLQAECGGGPPEGPRAKHGAHSQPICGAVRIRIARPISAPDAPVAVAHPRRDTSRADHAGHRRLRGRRRAQRRGPINACEGLPASQWHVHCA
jgi:hypothetical protein